MSFKNLVFILGLLTVMGHVSSLDLPPGLFLCGRKTPDIEKCGIKSIASMDRYFRSGIPEFKVLPLDPMFIEEVTIADIPDFHALSTNCNLKGLANFTLSNFKVDPEKQTIESVLTYSKLVLDMDFAVSAKIIVPIEEKGRLVADTDKVIAVLTLKYKKYDKKGVSRLYFPSASLKLDITGYKALYTSPNDSPLAEAINSVIESSQKELIDSMEPHMEKAISKKILDITNRFCKQYTFDELCPDHE